MRTLSVPEREESPSGVPEPVKSSGGQTDARNATTCQAVDDFRNDVYAGSKTAVAPNPDNACATSFGNTDTEGAMIKY